MIGTDSTAPYSLVWDARKAGLGSHVLTATAMDVAGNTGAAAQITVTLTR